ncbi:two-component regulator propeller domain-containing protein [Lewinella sp. LCG006]|uniref:hybrid sensor histidine kinase/response regulator n=1 Tax=Lewinella sp. LCG006 TaxID=3231911 RepID=UPI0034608AFC
MHESGLKYLWIVAVAVDALLHKAGPLVALMVFSCCCSLGAQTRVTQFDQIGVPEGLPEGHAFDIVQDQIGYLWIASYEGLFRYDGQNAKGFTSSNGVELTNERITDLEPTDSNGLWVATYKGLNYIDLRTGTCRQFLNTSERPNLFSDAHIQELIEDQHGFLWCATQAGVSVINPDKEEFAQLAEKVIVTDYCLDKRNEVLYAASDQGLIQLHSAPLGYSVIVPVGSPAYPSGMTIYQVYQGRNGQLWVGTSHGLWWLDVVTHELKRPEDWPGNQLEVSVRAILEDRNNDLWLGTTKGAIQWLRSQHRIGWHRHDENLQTTIGSDFIQSLYEDNNGNIWIGHALGLSKINPQQKKFALYQTDASLSYNNLNNHFQRLHQRPDGSFLFFTRYTIYRSAYLGAPLEELNDIPFPYYMERFLERSNGELWLAYSAPGKGIYRYEPEKNRLVKVPLKGYFDQQNCFDLEEDIDNPNVLWIGTSEGLCRYHAITGDTMWVHPVLPNGDVKGHIRGFTQTSDGNMWLLAGYMLAKMDKSDFRLTYFPPSDIPHAGPVGDHVREVIEYPEGKLWIALNQGFSSYDMKTGLFQNYGKQEGLEKGALIYALLPAKDGKIWLCTRSNIICFDPEQASFQYYSIPDGVNTGFNRLSYLSAQDGSLLFGGTNGLVAFHPDSIQPNNNRPALVLKDVWIDNHRLAAATQAAYISSLELPAQSSVLTLEVQVLEYIAPARNLYAYRMLGYDKEWIDNGNERRITYTRLPPGAYTLQIKATNYDGVWADDQWLEIAVNVLPNYWQTIYFRAFIILLVSLVLFLFMRNLQQKRKLREEKVIAETNSRYKSKFLANMSHEIRTPLNAIMGLNQLLLGTKLNERQQQFASAIQESSSNLLVIVNDILDQEKIERGRYRFVQRPFELETVLQQLHNTFFYRAQEKGLVFSIHRQREIPQTLIGDPIRLYQILTNLLGNALKFTEKGTIELSVNLLDIKREEEKLSLQFCVRDTGIGIPKDQQGAIFEPFHQLEEIIDYTDTGTGLGLSISKELIEQQGGAIQLESTVGQGTTFCFALPYGWRSHIDSIPKQSSDDASVDFHGMTLLLVEDNEFNRLLTIEILKNKLQGVTIDLAENGQVAVEMQASKTYDLILMDVRMPIMDGFEASRSIRKVAPNIPILGLTANVIPEEVAKCKQSGMNDVVTKPIDAAELLQKILLLLNK